MYVFYSLSLSLTDTHSLELFPQVTGDNGAPTDQCDFGGLNAPFNGEYLHDSYNGAGGVGKTTTWEGGHREPGVAVFPGHIRAGSRSKSLASALDILPTIASLCNVPLPANRRYDGVDLTPVLLGLSSNVTRYHGNSLFHPNSGCEGAIGDIETLRLGKFKVKYRTGGKCTSCDGRTAPDVYHDPPLVFDLDLDPMEKTPIRVDSNGEYKNHPGLLKKIRDAKQALEVDLSTDNVTIANYSQNISLRPCCNASNPFCSCSSSNDEVKFI